MSDVMIEARGLTKVYGNTKAIDDVSFRVRRGEVLGFLGPNGAGKTTTMKILTCFIAPTTGTALINGKDVFADSLGVRQAIGYLPESTPLYTEMMVIEYLEWAAEMRGLRGDAKKRAIKRVVDETSLGAMLGKEIRELSKGYKQRVGLAQALIHTPEILILDEPMSGLDPNQAVEIRELITSIGKERTVILSTHNLAEVQVSCDRVLIIAGGKIVADDKPAALTERGGKSRIVATFLPGEKSRDELATLLGNLPGAGRVRAIDDVGSNELGFELLPSGDGDLRAAIFRAAVESGETLVGLRREGQNLEDVFRNLTQDASKDASKTDAKKEAA